MSDEITNPEPTEIDEPVTDPQGDVTPDIDWKAEARKWEKRAKDANGDRELANKWREYEASLKPEQERLAEDLVAARAEAESARISLLRYEIAAEKQIPGDAIKLLNGSTREELEDAADALVALIAAQSKPKSPKPDPSQGKPANGSVTTASAFAEALGDLL